MASQLECRLFNRTLSIDDISKKPNCKNLKFKRAFQFLQLLLIQRVYGIDVTACPLIRRAIKHSKREQQQQQSCFEVFLGGSCNPTTWRHDQAIPYLKSREVSYFNPQVANWTPDLVEVEHRAKELAPLLFFVIDYDTRALASIVEVCYLAARGRRIIVVMNPMPERNYTKFIQQKTSNLEENDDINDYENVCDARQTLRTLLRSINIPVFDNVLLALECAAFILETTKRTVSHQIVFDEDNDDKNSDQDVLTPLPMSPDDPHNIRGSSVVVIRSLSNKTSFDSTDEFYKEMHQSEMVESSSISFHRRRNSTPESSAPQFQLTSICTKTQTSCTTNESDDDGYASLSSSNRTLSISSTSLSSESFESTIEQSRDENSLDSRNTLSSSKINHLISTFYSYIPFVSPSGQADSTVTQSLLVLFTLPFRFIKETIFPNPSSVPSSPSAVAAAKPIASTPLMQESVHLNSSSSSISLQTPHYLFDLYIASGEYDECWLNTFALPGLNQSNITYTKRQSYNDNDQSDGLYDIHVRKQSRVLYYLINGCERLSHLAAELAFLIGERKHKIIVYLQTSIDDDCKTILSTCERRDLHRSRKYLEDLARKENITLSYSREQSWQEVLTFFHQDN